MEFISFLLSIGVFGLFIRSYFLKTKIEELKSENKENEIEKKITEMSIERLKIKHDIERANLDELVNRKRKGGDDS